MVTVISSIIILASILLIFVVYIQNPKGGGLSSDFGAAQQIGGVQKTNDFMIRPIWIAIPFVIEASNAQLICCSGGRCCSRCCCFDDDDII